MPLELIRQDLLAMQVDAIVNPANPTLLGGGGLDGAIHEAAGAELTEACRRLGGCPTGFSKLTPAFALPCRAVIHTVGPVWEGGGNGEEKLLRSCYRTALQLAAEENYQSVAFPLISAGTNGYPIDEAFRVAIDEIGSFLLSHEMKVYLVLYDREAFDISRRLFPDISDYVRDRYVERKQRRRRSERRGYRDYRDRPDNRPEPRDEREDGLFGAPHSGFFRPSVIRPDDSETDDYSSAGSGFPDAFFSSTAPDAFSLPSEAGEKDEEYVTIASTSSVEPERPEAPGRQDLSWLLGHLDESFQQMLLRKIDEKGMTDAEVYKRANIDRKHFSKIRSNVHYRPSKRTVVALAVSMRMDLTETKKLLSRAGFLLSRSSVFDVIIEYFISNGIYDIFAINEALLAYDQQTLGG